MSWKEGLHRGSPYQLSEGDEPRFYSHNFGASRTDGALNHDVSSRFDLGGRAEAATYCSIAGEGGAEAQVGQLIEIDGNPSQSLEIEVYALWSGIQEIIGAGSSRLVFQSLVIDDDAPTWPEDNQYTMDQLVYVDNTADATDIGAPPVFQDSVTNDGSGSNPEPHFISNPTNGDVFRVVIAVTTSASVPYSFASARSEAMDDGTNAFNGYVTPGWIEFNWV